MAVFILLLAIYLWTMAPGNFWVDSAAFTTCNEILGLPHAPSFPLYTILGRFFHIILPVSPAMASNLYSAITSSMSGVVVYAILMLLIGHIYNGFKLRRLISACGAVFVCLSLPVWQSSVRAEVYALQILLMLLVIYFVLQTWFDKEGRASRYAIMAVFMQGLAFTNHSLLALITIPLVLAMLFRQFSANNTRHVILRTLVPSILVFAIALTVYAYLPIRANQDPAVNAGQPKTLQQAYNSITRSGEDYLPEGKIPAPNYIHRAGKLAVFIFDQTGGLFILGLIFAILIGIKQPNRILLWLFGSSLLGFAVTIWAADFRMYNFDIVAYAGIPLALLIVLSFTGLYEVLRRLDNKPQFSKYAPAVFILMAFFELYSNLYAADLSTTKGPDVLAESILEYAPENAIVFVNEDDIILPLWYHHYALGKRPDITVISAGALYRPDYRAQLKINNPDLKLPVGYNDRKITDLTALIEGIRRNNPNRPIQAQFGTPGFAAEYLYPDGFLFRYTEEAGYTPTEPERTAKIFLRIAGSATDLLTREFLGRNAFNTGVYYDQRGMGDKAYLYFQYAIEVDDSNPDYLLRLGIAFLDAGRTDDARALLKQATETGDGCPEAEEILYRLDARKFSIR